MTRDGFCPVCGDDAYRPDAYTARREARRCKRCHYIVGRCKCGSLPDLRARVVSAIAVSPGWDHNSADALVTALLRAKGEPR